MGPTEKIIYEYARLDHYLVRPLAEEEVSGLIQNLFSRLNSDSDEFNFTIQSIRTLEKKLLEFYDELRQNNNSLSTDETLYLVREITAYIGKTLIADVGGKWDTLAQYINQSAVSMSGVWKVEEENGSTYTPDLPPLILVGAGAAMVWDDIISNNKPRLYQGLKNMKKKFLPREHL